MSKTNENLKSEIIKLISDGKANEAITLLVNNFDTKEEGYRNIILLGYQLSKINKDFNSGLLSYENKRIHENNVVHSIMNQLSSLDSLEDLEIANDSPQEKTLKLDQLHIERVKAIKDLWGQTKIL